MSTLSTFRIPLGLFFGTALGVFLADANWWHHDNGVVLCTLKVPLLYSILYYPSGWLFYSCRFLHVGPSGSAAWTMYPWCVIAVWTLIGLLLGLCFRGDVPRGSQFLQMIHQDRLRT